MPTSKLLRQHQVRPWRLFSLVLITVFAVEVLVMIALPQVLPDASEMSAAIWDACVLTATLAPLLWILVVRPLHRLAELRQRLFSLALTAQETERGRIARDLHDGIGQGLTCVLVGLRAIEETSSEPPVQAQARELRRIGGDTHEEIRRMARGLRPAALDDLGLIPAVERLLDDVRSIQDVETSFRLEVPAGVRFPSGVETTLYRIVQEALNNAVRHAAARNIAVELRTSADLVTLQISDDGRGFKPDALAETEAGERMFGLSSIRERAWLAGGEAILRSTPGGGSQLTVQIPWKPGDAADGQNANSDRG